MKTRKKKPVSTVAVSETAKLSEGVEPVARAAEPQAPAETGAPTSVGFPIVGIGASAGGLAAFEAFFSGMPADTDPGMAFVLVQHLAPGHKSLLAALIRRYTRMQVFEVEDGMAVQPNCVYVIPPNCDMVFLNGALHLTDPSVAHGQRLTIDFFFRSLAQEQRERAICIVLSGIGSDGTLGVRAIKGNGGMVMAQKLESNEYDGMPRSAIATGLVDYELPPAEMPAQLIAYVEHVFGKPPESANDPLHKTESAMKKIFLLLRVQTGHDFSQYKPNTIHRRIDRRMAVNQIKVIDNYVQYLQQDPAEVEALFRDLLIGVTNFFRDAEAFTALEKQTIPRLFADRDADSAIRVWVPACSTGEEAYSIAILLQERLEALKQGHKAQIFATDVDGQAIATARAGIYPANIAADISPERLERFFDVEPDGSYRVQKDIRDMLVFSEQDLVRDPPFSRLDLISCRNLLIYMGAKLQKKFIPLFYYALNPGGFLFLGTSETVGEFDALFDALDRKAKLYHRKDDALNIPRMSLERSVFALQTGRASAPAPLSAQLKTGGLKKSSAREVTERALLQQVAPTAVLVDDNGDILYLHGRTGMYLEPAPGEPGINILKMAREGLRYDLASALNKAAATNEPVCHPGLHVKTNGHFTAVKLTVRPVPPLTPATSESRAYLVILEEASSDTSGTSDPSDTRVEALKRELCAKEEYLQSANEALETSNEELQSSNEEMQSVNEELQAANEELETSKEELHSVNEELATVNMELQNKVAALTRSNNDMNNLLAGTGIATIFVDLRQNIMRFTPAATQIIHLIPGDVGRPVDHLVTKLRYYDRLTAVVQSVLDTQVHREVEVQTVEGEWYIMRIQPYLTPDNAIEGAVLTFVPISERKQMEDKLRETVSILDAAMNQSTAGIAIADAPDGKLRFVNDAGLLIRGGDREAVMNGVGIDQYVSTWRLLDLDGRPLAPEEVPLARAIMFGETCSREFIIRRAETDDRMVMARAAPIKDAAGNVVAGIVVFLDITERKHAEIKIASQLEELRRWQNVMLGREDRVLELKREVNDYCSRVGEAPRYPSQEDAALELGKTQTKQEHKR
jgi:two-component system CheB/CheR fusion protein